MKQKLSKHVDVCVGKNKSEDQGFPNSSSQLSWCCHLGSSRSKIAAPKSQKITWDPSWWHLGEQEGHPMAPLWVCYSTLYSVQYSVLWCPLLEPLAKKILENVYGIPALLDAKECACFGMLEISDYQTVYSHVFLLWHIRSGKYLSVKNKNIIIKPLWIYSNTVYSAFLSNWIDKIK